MTTIPAPAAKAGFLKKIRLSRQLALIGGIALVGIVAIAATAVTTNTISSPPATRPTR